MTDVPEEYDAEAYRAGYEAAWAEVGRLALDRTAEREDEPEDPDAADECRTCGAGTRLAMGRDASEHTPEGRVCVACEL